MKRKTSWIVQLCLATFIFTIAYSTALSWLVAEPADPANCIRGLDPTSRKKKEVCIQNAGCERGFKCEMYVENGTPHCGCVATRKKMTLESLGN